MYLSLIGYLMIITIVYLLLKGKMSPLVVFTLIPIIFAKIAGFSNSEVIEFLKKGLGTTTTMAILFIFSVTYFGIMSDSGMFDVIVNKLVKKAGTNVVAVAIVTAIIGICSHLDGATVTTVLVTVPAMLPIYKKLNMKPHLLLLIIGSAMGVMNLVPWGGPTARAAAVLKMDPNELWKILIPIQLVGIILTFAIAILMSIKESKSQTKEILEKKAKENKSLIRNMEQNNLKRDDLIFFNLGLTALILIILIFTKIPSHMVFMIGCTLALAVNYPNIKEQEKRIKAHSSAALSISATMLSAGSLVGILGNSGMLEAMSTPLLTLVPKAIAPFLHLIIAIFALPLGTVIGADSYYYGLMPLAMEVGSNYQIAPLNMALTMLIGKNLGMIVSPLVPATFLAVGLTGIELKEHIRYCFPCLWISSIITVVIGILLGIILI